MYVIFNTELSAKELMLLNCGAGEDSWTAMRSDQSILKEINSEHSLEGPMLKLKFQYFGQSMGRAKSWGKTLMLERLKAKGEAGKRVR